MRRKTIVQSYVLQTWHAAQMHARQLHRVKTSRTLFGGIADDAQRLQTAATTDIGKEYFKPVGLPG